MNSADTQTRQATRSQRHQEKCGSSALTDPAPSGDKKKKRAVSTRKTPTSRKRNRSSSMDETKPADSETNTAETVEVQDECVICMERVETRGVINCCDHIFCSPCILKWSKVTNKCPVCKQAFNTITTAPRPVPPPTKGKRRRAAPKPKIHKVKNKEQHVAPNYGGSLRLNIENFITPFHIMDVGRRYGHPMIGGLPFFLSRAGQMIEFFSFMDDGNDSDYVEGEQEEEEEEEFSGFLDFMSTTHFPHSSHFQPTPVFGNRNHRELSSSSAIIEISDDESDYPSRSSSRVGSSPQFVDLTQDDSDGNDDAGYTVSSP